MGTPRSTSQFPGFARPRGHHGAFPAPLFANERLVAFDKPSGLLSVPGRGPENADCLPRRITPQFPTALIVHRLDRDTSGVIVMALNADAHRALSRQFHDRLVEKRYFAVVAGNLAEPSGEIDLPMRCDIDRRPIQIVDHEQGRSAQTRYRVVAADRTTTRLELTPITGRSHQLRVHCAAIGHPILGDDLYAPPAAREAAPRLMLHAEWLSVTDPETGERLTFVAPCPF